MRKKIFLIAVAVSLVAIMVGGSLAYFTAEDSVTNAFTIGSVEIKVDENFTSPTGMLPIVNVEEPSADVNYVEKDAKITNIGKNDAYVQAFVAVPSALDDAGAFHIEDADSSEWTKSDSPVGTVTIEGVEYNVYQYVYNSILPATNPDSSTPLFITGAYLDAALDVREDANQVRRFVMNGEMIENFDISVPINVYVAGQGVQAEGFGESAVAADVLNQAFGTSLPSFGI